MITFIFLAKCIGYFTGGLMIGIGIRKLEEKLKAEENEEQ